MFLVDVCINEENRKESTISTSKTLNYWLTITSHLIASCIVVVVVVVGAAFLVFIFFFICFHHTQPWSNTMSSRMLSEQQRQQQQQHHKYFVWWFIKCWSWIYVYERYYAHWWCSGISPAMRFVQQPSISKIHFEMNTTTEHKHIIKFHDQFSIVRFINFMKWWLRLPHHTHIHTWAHFDRLECKTCYP